MGHREAESLAGAVRCGVAGLGLGPELGFSGTRVIGVCLRSCWGGMAGAVRSLDHNSQSTVSTGVGYDASTCLELGSTKDLVSNEGCVSKSGVLC